MNVKEIMTKDLVSLSLNNNCGEAAEKMRQFNIGDVLVTDGNELKGIITDRDITLRCTAEKIDPWEASLSDIATIDPLTVSPETPISECSEIMSENQIRRLPILFDGELVGIISLGDLAVDAPEESDVEDVLEEISQPTR